MNIYSSNIYVTEEDYRQMERRALKMLENERRSRERRPFRERKSHTKPFGRPIRRFC